MYKFVGVVFLIFASNLAAASDVRYTEFKCNSERDALKCSSECSMTDLSYLFIVNTSTGVVFQKSFYEGRHTTTDELKNCRVADANNWICGTGRNSEEASKSLKEEKLSDGIFTDIFENHYPKNSGFKDDLDYRCAKKINGNHRASN